MKVISVQIGKACPSEAASLASTGIDKEPVDEIEVNVDGIVGDEIVDQKNHVAPTKLSISIQKPTTTSGVKRRVASLLRVTLEKTLR